MKAKLTEDIYSSSKKLQYGKKEEQVVVVYYLHNVLIVQNSNGFKFPVHRSKVEILSTI